MIDLRLVCALLSCCRRKVEISFLNFVVPRVMRQVRHHTQNKEGRKDEPYSQAGNLEEYG